MENFLAAISSVMDSESEAHDPLGLMAGLNLAYKMASDGLRKPAEAPEVLSVSVWSDGHPTALLEGLYEGGGAIAEGAWAVIRTVVDAYRRGDKQITVEFLIPDPEDEDEAAGGTQLENTTEVVFNVHPKDKCAGTTCTIHKRTNHKMREFPQHWREDRNFMERVCTHGVGHPDPDQREFLVGRYGWMTARGMFVHGCDGCCAPTPWR